MLYSTSSGNWYPVGTNTYPETGSAPSRGLPSLEEESNRSTLGISEIYIYKFKNQFLSIIGIFRLFLLFSIFII
jgi:hypothetical protein